MDFAPIHFFDTPIEVAFDTPPVRQKSPPCPDGFTWEGRTHRVVEKLAEWVDFSRRGRMARNMRPAHAAVASGRGSLGVGRFYFRVQVDPGRIFDIYYDREIKDVDDRLGHWFLYRELAPGGVPAAGDGGLSNFL
ncbi:MAG: hypothetical protein HY781_07180 [Chloroflexi bacterium]|nr:hypothetical protein [Chloroflexota bacterium]